MSRKKLYNSIKQQIMQNNPEEFAAYKKKRVNTSMREQKLSTVLNGNKIAVKNANQNSIGILKKMI